MECIDAHVDEEKSPRGVRGFMLNSGDFGEWKVQGKIGGYSKFVKTYTLRILFNILDQLPG